MAEEVPIASGTSARAVIAVAVAGLVALAIVVIGIVNRDDGPGSEVATDDTVGDSIPDSASGEADDAEDRAVTEPVVLMPPEPGASIDGATPCPAEDGSAQRTTSFAEPPPMCLEPGVDYSASIETDTGTLLVDLDETNAPMTVNNFVVLARYHYYDGVPFHRIIPDFVVQGGDAVGDPLGIGGPGYTITDELPEPGAYEVGSMAMANAAQPDTSGSQFFFVTGASGMALPAQYSLFGQVVDGLDVLADLDALGSEGAGRPTAEVVIRDVQIIES